MEDKAKRYMRYYAFALALISVMVYVPAFKSGPCTPNFDMLGALAGFILGLVSFIFLLVSIVAFLQQKAGKRMIAVHGCAFIVLFLILLI